MALHLYFLTLFPVTINSYKKLEENLLKTSGLDGTIIRYPTFYLHPPPTPLNNFYLPIFHHWLRQAGMTAKY